MLKTLLHGYNLLRHSLRDVGTGVSRSSHWPTVEKHFKEKHPTCACCGSTVRLQVHHKKPFHLDPSLELDENNLITLCMSPRECHLLIGHGDNFKAYNPFVENDCQTLQHDLGLFAQVAANAKKNRLTQ